MGERGRGLGWGHPDKPKPRARTVREFRRKEDGARLLGANGGSCRRAERIWAVVAQRRGAHEQQRATWVLIERLDECTIVEDAHPTQHNVPSVRSIGGMAEGTGTQT